MKKLICAMILAVVLAGCAATTMVDNDPLVERVKADTADPWVYDGFWAFMEVLSVIGQFAWPMPLWR